MEYFGFDFGQFEMPLGLHPNAPILEGKLRKIQEREENFVLTLAKGTRTLESIMHGERTQTSEEKTPAGREHL